MLYDEEYALFNTIRPTIKNMVLNYFYFINDGCIEKIKPFVSQNFYDLILLEYNNFEKLGLKQVYKDIVIFDEDWDVLERDDLGAKTILYTAKISIEMYIINKETREIVDGVNEYQEEIKYDVVLSRNNISTPIDTSICMYCGAKLDENSKRCDYCGLENDYTHYPWIIDLIEEISRRNFHEEYAKNNELYNKKEWVELQEEIRARTRALSDGLFGRGVYRGIR